MQVKYLTQGHKERCAHTVRGVEPGTLGGKPEDNYYPSGKNAAEGSESSDQLSSIIFGNETFGDNRQLRSRCVCVA